MLSDLAGLSTDYESGSFGLFFVETFGYKAGIPLTPGVV
jgi:hypothetical protein